MQHWVLEGCYEELAPEGVWRPERGDIVIHPPFHLHVNRIIRRATIVNVLVPHEHVMGLGAARYGVYKIRNAERLVRKFSSAGALREALDGAENCPALGVHDWIDRFADDLRACPDLTIAVLAQAYDICPEHAARAFKQRFGLSPRTFRTEQKLRAGITAVFEHKLALADAAHESGYADQAHFSRALSRATGQTPGGVRRALLRNQIRSRPREGA